MKACWLLLVTGTLATPAAAAASPAPPAPPVPPDPVNSVIAWAPGLGAERARLDRACRGRPAPCGLPVLVKDNIDIAGMVTTAGSRALAANLRPADAPLVARMRRAGLLILGKTNLSEWANFRASASISGWSGVGGQTRNPHVLDRNPCGSSSGSGAAVAAGVAPAAIGTETNGSITCPAAVNGIVGLKPTVGLVSRTGIVPISHSQDTAGPMAIDIETTARLLTVIAGSDPADPATREADRRRTDYAAGLAGASLRGVRLGVLRFATGWSPPVDSAFEAALETLRREGAILVDIAEVPDRRAIGEAELQVLLSEFKAGVNAYLATTPPTVRTRTLADVIAFNRADSARSLGLFGQDLLERAEQTAGLDDPAYQGARATSLKLAAGWLEAAFKTHRVEALLAPTAPPAWKIDAVNGDQAPFGGAPGLAAVAGTPHLTVPMARHLGLPLGLSFLGPAWSEARLLQLGAAWERARGPLPPPAFRPSLETAPEIAPLFQPMPR